MTTHAAPVSEGQRLALSEVLADSRVMAARQMRKILRRPMYVIYLLVQPVISCCCSATYSAARSTPAA